MNGQQQIERIRRRRHNTLSESVLTLELFQGKRGSMDSDFKVTSAQRQAAVPVTVFHVNGWLDAQSEGKLPALARQSHMGGTRHPLIGLSGLDTLTCAGIKCLQKIYQLYTPKDENINGTHQT